jgi:hypothetical protein
MIFGWKLASLAIYSSRAQSATGRNEMQLKKLRLILRRGCRRRLDAEADGLTNVRPRLIDFYF